jgi:phosphonate transport system substrate-binding protein
MKLQEKRAAVRFAVPSSLGGDLSARVEQLRGFLSLKLGRETEVVVPSSYEALARELLAGRVDAAWAPPFVCARIEAMGVRVLVRGVRDGSSTYRAALVCRKEATIDLLALAGATAAWTDRDSVGGYLLPMAYLREKGVNASTAFLKQHFSGNYKSALEMVLAAQADLTSVFAPRSGETTGLKEIWPEQADAFRVLAFTAEAPNDGVAVSMNAPASLVSELERCFLSMHETPEGTPVLAGCFRAERFEVAPRMGYRALYRVALASL